MKRFIILIFLYMAASPVYSQVIAIQNDRENVFYIGTDNLLTMAMEQCPQDDILVTCDKCEMMRRSPGDHNHYIVHVDTPGIVLVTLQKKVGKEFTTIDVRRYRAAYLPDPKVYYAFKKGGSLSLADISDEFIPVAKLIGFDHAPRYAIDSFTIMVLRDDKLIYTTRQPGGRQFDTQTLATLKTLKENDKLLFADITCHTTDKRILHPAAMEFVIKNNTIPVNKEEK